MAVLARGLHGSEAAAAGGPAFLSRWVLQVAGVVVKSMCFGHTDLNLSPGSVVLSLSFLFYEIERTPPSFLGYGKV